MHKKTIYTLLLEAGVDPNAISPWFNERRPLIESAYFQNNEAIFELLLKHGAKISDSVLYTPVVDECISEICSGYGSAFKYRNS